MYEDKPELVTPEAKIPQPLTTERVHQLNERLIKLTSFDEENKLQALSNISKLLSEDETAIAVQNEIERKVLEFYGKPTEDVIKDRLLQVTRSQPQWEGNSVSGILMFAEILKLNTELSEKLSDSGDPLNKELSDFVNNTTALRTRNRVIPQK